MKPIFWLVLALSLGRAFGADTTTVYTWDSPDKRYRAVWSVDTIHTFSTFKIVSLADPGAPPLLEGGDGGPAPDAPQPAMVGVWSSDGRRLAVYSITKGQSAGYWLGADLYALQDSGPNSHAKFDQVVNETKATPASLESDVTESLASLQSSIGQMDFGAFTVDACRWKPNQLVEMDCQMNFAAESKDGLPRFPYHAKWTVTNRLTDNGFEYVGISPISYTRLDIYGKEGAWQTLPITDQDRLRIAVRLNMPDQVSALLAKGVDPNKETGDNLAALAAEVKGAQELALLLKTGVDINLRAARGLSSMEWAILANDPVILEEMLTGKPSRESDSSFDVYEMLISTLPRTETHADVVGKLGPVDAEAAFLKKLPMLVAAKYDINASDEKSGKTALMLAVENHFSPRLIQAMVAAGADPHKKDGEGKSAVDIAVDTRQLPTLRLLDTGHRYADLLKSYVIPAMSALVGTWADGDDMYLVLSADGTGNLASMLACKLTWKEVNGIAKIEFHALKTSDPKGNFAGTAQLGADSDTLVLTLDGPGQHPETLHREESK